jgi:hypothetical protein
MWMQKTKFAYKDGRKLTRFSNFSGGNNARFSGKVIAKSQWNTSQDAGVAGRLRVTL